LFFCKNSCNAFDLKIIEEHITRLLKWQPFSKIFNEKTVKLFTCTITWIMASLSRMPQHLCAHRRLMVKQVAVRVTRVVVTAVRGEFS